jgi:hypothetical protein
MVIFHSYVKLPEGNVQSSNRAEPWAPGHAFLSLSYRLYMHRLAMIVVNLLEPQLGVVIGPLKQSFFKPIRSWATLPTQNTNFTHSAESPSKYNTHKLNLPVKNRTYEI